MTIPIKTGLILFTHNNFKVGRPLSALSGIINFFQTWRLKNPDHKPTHTAQTIVLFDELYVIDSDNDGMEPEKWESWKQGRAWIHVFDPKILTPETEIEYIKKALGKSGQRYGFEDIGPELLYLISGKYKGETDPNKADDSMICSVATAYLYTYQYWWRRYPLDLFINRFKDAPFGVDIFSGKPNDF